MHTRERCIRKPHRDKHTYIKMSGCWKKYTQKENNRVLNLLCVFSTLSPSFPHCWTIWFGKFPPFYFFNLRLFSCLLSKSPEQDQKEGMIMEQELQEEKKRDNLKKYIEKNREKRVLLACDRPRRPGFSIYPLSTGPLEVGVDQRRRPSLGWLMTA
jgi:hypothetical protein